MPAFFGGALSLGFFVLRQKTQGGEVRTLPVFLDYLILFLGGDARHFLRAFSVVFVCGSQESPHAGTFTIIL